MKRQTRTTRPFWNRASSFGLQLPLQRLAWKRAAMLSHFAKRCPRRYRHHRVSFPCLRPSVRTTVPSSYSTKSRSYSAGASFTETKRAFAWASFEHAAEKNNRLLTPFRFVRRTQAPAPGPQRRIAYDTGSALPGPHLDPSGWYSRTVILQGQVLGRAVEVHCQACRLLYAHCPSDTFCPVLSSCACGIPQRRLSDTHLGTSANEGSAGTRNNHVCWPSASFAGPRAVLGDDHYERQREV